jgi:hypothetical protein
LGVERGEAVDEQAAVFEGGRLAACGVNRRRTDATTNLGICRSDLAQRSVAVTSDRRRALHGGVGDLALHTSFDERKEESRGGMQAEAATKVAEH